MKKLMITFLVILMYSSFGWTQIETPIKEETRSCSYGSFNALVMELKGVSAKEANKAWDKHIKAFKGKTKYDRKINEYFSDDATIKDMSDNNVDVIAKIEERGTEGSVIIVWFNLGVTYLSSKDYPERYPAGEKILKDYARILSADMIQAELDSAKKLLKDYEDNLKRLEKEKAQQLKNIEDYKATIKKMEESIVVAEEEIKKSDEAQGTAKLTIDEQKKIIEDIQKRLDSVK